MARVFAVNAIGPALVLRNASPPENYWLLVNTVGTRSNREGIGAALRLVISTGERRSQGQAWGARSVDLCCT